MYDLIDGKNEGKKDGASVVDFFTWSFARDQALIFIFSLLQHSAFVAVRFSNVSLRRRDK